MTKASRKYILTLFILLLSGYGYMRAGSSQDWIRESAIKFLQNSFHEGAYTKLNSQTQFVRYSVSGTDENDKICSEENKEENYKLTALRPFSPAGNYFTAFYTKVSGGFFYSIQKSLPVSTHWFHSSSSRYIVLRVFRI